jgi:hypothetical protein
MEKNMSGIQPRTLTNNELARFAETLLYRPEGMPVDYQKELLRRFMQADIQDARPYPQLGQQDLFK